MKEFHTSFKYQKDEVVPAQRARYTHSRQIKTILILGIVATVVLTGQKIYEWRAGQEAVQWLSPVFIALIFAGVLLLSYLLMPVIDFYTNREWKAEFDMTVDEARLKLTVAGAPNGYELEWTKVKRVIETEKAYILYFGQGSQDLVFLPKRALESANFRSNFRQFLVKKGATTWLVA